MSTALPAGINPILDAAIEAEARRLQVEFRVGFLAEDIGTHRVFAVVIEALLRNLSRPASRDWCARWLAAHHGLECRATAPGWRRSEPTKRGMPGCWALGLGDQTVYFHDPHYLTDTATTVRQRIRIPGISALTDPAEALCAACLAAVGRAS